MFFRILKFTPMEYLKKKKKQKCIQCMFYYDLNVFGTIKKSLANKISFFAAWD